MRRVIASFSAAARAAAPRFLMPSSFLRSQFPSLAPRQPTTLAAHRRLHRL